MASQQAWQRPSHVLVGAITDQLLLSTHFVSRDVLLVVASLPSPPHCTSQVPAELVSTIQLLQRVLNRVRYPGEGAVAAPFGPSKAGKSHLLSLMVGILVTHLTYELLPPQHTRFVMDRAGDAIIK
jgi:hypothetical protein